MDVHQGWLHAVGIVAALASLMGLLLRRRATWAYFFVLYLGLVAGYGIVVALRPDVVVWRVWVMKELVLAVVALLTGLEIGVRLIADRRGARPHAARAVLVVMALTLLVVFVGTPAPALGPVLHTSAADVDAFEQAFRLLPGLAYGSAWLFTALWRVARRFAIPLSRLHHAILVGFAVFWLLQAFSLGVLDGPRHARLVSDVLTGSFLALLLVWAWAAWAAQPEPDASPEVVRDVWRFWR